MNQPAQLTDENIKKVSKTIWFAIQASPLMLMVFVYFSNMLNLMHSVMPEMKDIFIIICFLSIGTPFFLLGHFKKLQNKIRDNIQLGIDNESSDLQRYYTFLVIGLALCDASAMFGFVLFILSGDVAYSYFFIAISFLLGFLYKPELK
ncbi:MAG: hypothetical protein ACPHLK_07930 [Gammaproteobacteria bacterium]|jgi:hypothetical protein